MNITPGLSDPAILEILGARLARQRIESQHTQADLAERAGISKRTLERLEAGRGAELVTLIRVLRALDLIGGLELLIPPLPPSPIAQLKLRGKERKRASRPRRTSDQAKKPWSWGK